MKLRIYIAPMIGSGTMNDPYRSKLNNYINPAAGESFSDYLNVSRLFSIAFCSAEDNTHTTIASDPEITILSPLAEQGEFGAELDKLFSSFPEAMRNAAIAELESCGINTGFISGSNTLRDILRAALRTITIMQISEGTQNQRIISFLKQSLDSTVGDVSLDIRNAVRTWMESRGLATGWIKNSTLVREIVHFIVMNMGFGKFKLFSQEF